MENPFFYILKFIMILGISVSLYLRLKSAGLPPRELTFANDERINLYRRGEIIPAELFGTMVN
jgi:hypothetical protein